MSVLHVVSVSGEKDSAATLLLALERHSRDRIIPIFCETGNEQVQVYEYLDYLEQALDIKITRLKEDFSDEFAHKRMFIARDQRTSRDDGGRKRRWTNKAKRRALAALHPTGNPFLDLCMLKGRFPSRMAQFCTKRLKRDPAVEFQMALVDQGHTVISWQGIRRDESERRREAKKFEKIGPHLFCYRPIVDWTAGDVFTYCADKGIQPNPLYKQGMNRVGCMPCINARKDEIRQIAIRFPEEIERISDWERIVSACSKRGFSTFFHKVDDKLSNREIFSRCKIETVIDWAQTTRGGKQLNLLAQLDEADDDVVFACASAYGLCDKE